MDKGEVKRRTFAKERAFLSEYACLSENTRGRQRPETACDMRTDFQRDRDRIIYSKAFLRLKNKTQVFFSPEGDHFRTRMTHTIDVSQIARSIARSLALNEDLADPSATRANGCLRASPRTAFSTTCSPCASSTCWKRRGRG